MEFKTTNHVYNINLPIGATVGMKISGGADSAIVAYMLALYRKKENPTIKFHFITTEHYAKPFQVIKSKEVIEFIDQEIGLGEYKHSTNVMMSEDDYIKKQEEIYVPLIDNNEIDFMFSGITANPPKDIMIAAEQDWLAKGINDNGRYRHFIFADRIVERDIEIKRLDYSWWDADKCHYICFSPLINTDKKGVAELYKSLGLLNTLFPITRSCEERTTDFSTTCERCWWCWERQYGFSGFV